MKPISQLASLSLAFGAAVACSDMTPLTPDLISSGAGKGGSSVSSSHSGSSNSSGSKTAASGGSRPTASGGQRTVAAGGQATSGSGISGGTGGAGVPDAVAPPRSANGGAGGAGKANGGATAHAGTGAGEAGGAGVGGSREPLRTKPPFFSEYVEGSANNKALELSIAEPGRLEGCVIRIYANGALAASRTILLTGPIVPDVPLVICSPQLSDLTGFACDFTETLPFNGNDAIVLACAGEVVDSIGQLGNDPGDAGWGSGALRTQDRTLRRLCTVTDGDREPSDVFELAADGWVAGGSDVFDGLGVRCESMGEDGGGAGGGGGGNGGGNGGATDAGGNAGAEAWTGN